MLRMRLETTNGIGHWMLYKGDKGSQYEPETTSLTSLKRIRLNFREDMVRVSSKVCVYKLKQNTEINTKSMFKLKSVMRLPQMAFCMISCKAQHTAHVIFITS